jgi:arylsulfatase A-like enzyme
MRLIFVAAAGALAPGLLLVLLDIGWTDVVDFTRERFFLVGLNAVFLGWLIAPIVRLLTKSPEGRNGRAFWTGAALGIAPWSIFAAGFAAASLVVAWRRPLALPGRPALAVGVAAHLLPIVAYLVPPSLALAPLQAPDPPLPSATVEGLGAAGPDVLLIVVDTLRADAILNPSVPTPNLDALRAQGVWADAALAPCNQTLPSHLALLTGLDIEKVGMRSNLSRWPSSEQLRADWGMRTLAERFQDVGYRTAAVVSNPLLSSVDTDAGLQDFEPGFEAWNGMQRYNYWQEFRQWYGKYTVLGRIIPARVTGYPLGKLLRPSAVRQYRHHYDEGRRSVNQAMPWLTELQNGDAPYFFLLHLMDPHSPYVPPPPSAGTQAIDRPAGFSDHALAELTMRVHLLDGIMDDELPENSAEVAEFLHQLYREEVTETDRQVGRVIDAVRASGRPTVILFTSDHGEQFLEHGWTEHSHTLYDEELLVPFIVAGPGVPQGVQLNFVPDLVDVGPTLFAVVGIDPIAQGGAALDGRNVIGAEGAARPGFAVMTDTIAIRDGRWKLHARVRYTNKEKPVEGEYETTPLHLYDLIADPGETVDLLQKELVEVERLLEILHGRMKLDLYWDLPPRKLRPEDQSHLDDLGYVE